MQPFRGVASVTFGEFAKDRADRAARKVDAEEQTGELGKPGELNPCFVSTSSERPPSHRHAAPFREDGRVVVLLLEKFPHLVGESQSRPKVLEGQTPLVTAGRARCPRRSLRRLSGRG